MSNTKLGFSKRRGATNFVMGLGLLIMTTTLAPFAIDIPAQLTYHTQLQNAVDAATLAAASSYSQGDAAAKSAAQTILNASNVAGQNPVTASTVNYTFDSSQNRISISASMSAPSIMRPILCSLTITVPNPNQPPNTTQPNTVTSQDCGSIPITAQATAIPQARDVFLVIDVSGSMADYSKITSAKTAAKNYLDYLIQQNSPSVDRVGLVSFSSSATVRYNMVSTTTDRGFTGLKSAINNLSANGGTNHSSGLNAAVSALLAQARPNSKRIIIFLTDGLTNLPAPSGSQWNSSNPFDYCINMVRNDATFIAHTCTTTYNSWTRRYVTTCPAVTPDLFLNNQQWIPQAGRDCGNTYLNNMQAANNAAINNAVANNITIYSIGLYNASDLANDDTSNYFRGISGQLNWDPKMVETMASATHGELYNVTNYQSGPGDLTTAYQDIAKNFRPILTHN